MSGRTVPEARCAVDAYLNVARLEADVFCPPLESVATAFAVRRTFSDACCLSAIEKLARPMRRASLSFFAVFLSSVSETVPLQATVQPTRMAAPFLRTDFRRALPTAICTESLPDEASGAGPDGAGADGGGVVVPSGVGAGAAVPPAAVNVTVPL